MNKSLKIITTLNKLFGKGKIKTLDNVLKYLELFCKLNSVKISKKQQKIIASKYYNKNIASKYYNGKYN